MDAHSHVVELLLCVTPRVMRALASELRKTTQHLSPGHFQILVSLAQSKSSLSALAEQADVSLPTMSSTVATLAERGWVISERDQQDRRRLLISLAPEGMAMLLQLRQAATERMTLELAGLTDAECHQIIAALSIIDRLLDDDTLPDCTSTHTSESIAASDAEAE